MSDAQLTVVARKAFERADTALNAAWRQAMKRMESADREASETSQGANSAELLRDAQRKWMSFRDAECLAHSQLTGGSADRLAYFGCMQSLTEARTKQVREWSTQP